MFLGVNKGYQGDAIAITEPEKAAEIVSEQISLAKRLAGDNNDYTALPALAVYEPERGCPIGGEPTAFLATNGHTLTVIAFGNNLRERFEQQTLSIVTYDQHNWGLRGTRTKGFFAEVGASLATVGKAWQESAADYSRKHGIYVSATMYKLSDETTIILTDANPDKFNDISQWERAAAEITAMVAKKLGTNTTPQFHTSGYTYLNHKEKAPDIR